MTFTERVSCIMLSITNLDCVVIEAELHASEVVAFVNIRAAIGQMCGTAVGASRNPRLQVHKNGVTTALFN